MTDAYHRIRLKAEQPRIFGSRAAIRRDCLIDEFLPDIGSTGIRKSACVRANGVPGRVADEAARVQSVADAKACPHQIAGFADFTVEDVGPQLEASRDFPLARGIRQQFHWHENPAFRFASRPDDLPADPVVQHNIAKFADFGGSFELRVFPSQMASAAELVGACPAVAFVPQRAGMLEDTSREGWKFRHEGMKMPTGFKNAVAKLSAHSFA